MEYVIGLDKSSLTKWVNWVLVSVVADQTDAGCTWHEVGRAGVLGRWWWWLLWWWVLVLCGDVSSVMLGIQTGFSLALEVVNCFVADPVPTSPFLGLYLPCCWVNLAWLVVGLEDVFVPLLLTALWFLPLIQLAKQRNLWNAFVSHPQDVASPGQLGMHDEQLDAADVASVLVIFSCQVMPHYVRQRMGLVSVEESWQDCGAVDLDLGT